MIRMTVFTAMALVLLLGSSCRKEEDDGGYRAAGITFRMDSGYTYQNDTALVNDTLLIGPMVSEGSRSLYMVYVERSINGGPWQRQDSVPFSANPMTFNVQAIMSPAPCTETWSIVALENGGNTTRRSLTFTVVE